MFAYNWAYTDDETEETTTLTWEDAACCDGQGALTPLFFSDEIPDIELAKAICSTCPLVEPCLRGAAGQARAGRRMGRAAVCGRRRHPAEAQARPAPQSGRGAAERTNIAANYPKGKCAPARAPSTRAQDRIAAFNQDCRPSEPWPRCRDRSVS